MGDVVVGWIIFGCVIIWFIKEFIRVDLLVLVDFFIIVRSGVLIVFKCGKI